MTVELVALVIMSSLSNGDHPLKYFAVYDSSMSH